MQTLCTNVANSFVHVCVFDLAIVVSCEDLEDFIPQLSPNTMHQSLKGPAGQSRGKTCLKCGMSAPDQKGMRLLRGENDYFDRLEHRYFLACSGTVAEGSELHAELD